MELKRKDDRFVYLDEKGLTVAEIVFPMAGRDVVDIESTYVDPTLRGQGIADKLMRAAVEDIRARGLQAYTSCGYAEKWFSAHPEYSALWKK
jgi:predicted GNAT family acetyltransferase